MINKSKNLINKDSKSDNKYNIIMITLFTILYLLLINKVSDILTISISDENKRLESFTMYIYFISIIGLVISYFWLENTNRGNYIISKGLTFGGVIMLLYTMFYYWEFLGDYSKLSLIIISILFIAYYAYQ
jgi:hypothetical protein